MSRLSDKVLNRMINEFYDIDGNVCGGNLHIVLDDGNYEESSVRFCLEQAEENEDMFGVYLAKELLKLTDEERMDLLGVDPEEQEI